MHKITPEVVAAIEQSPFRPAEKFHLLTTVLGLRPACWIGVKSAPWLPGHEPLKVPLETEWAAYDAVSSVGLKVVRLTRLIDTQERSGNDFIAMQRMRAEYMVAHYADVASEIKNLLDVIHAPLSEACREEDLVRRFDASRQLGRRMGYPPTAITAYCSGEMFPPDQVSDEILTPELRPFFSFAFSREHVVEEVAVLRQWVEACAEISPKIHGEVLAKEVPA